MIEDYSIYTSAKWSCRKNEQDIDGKGKKHAQWCRVRIGILGRGSGDSMLPDQQITSSVFVKDSGHHISPQWYDIVHFGPKALMDLFLGFTPKGLIPMEIFVHPYIPMILPTSSQCGTLVIYPTILPSNKGPSSLPQNDYPSAGFSPLYQPGFSAPMHWKHTTYMVAPPVSRACSNRAHPRIPL